MFWNTDFISSNPLENLPLFFDKGNNNCILFCFYFTKYKTRCSIGGQPCDEENPLTPRVFMHSCAGNFLQPET